MFVAGKLFQKAGEGSGGDKHNKGYFVDESALTTAYPTAEAGDYAIVESTDTVWIWDSDNQEWVDSDQKGQVTSVNNQTGDVVLDLLPTQTGNAGKFLTTDGTDASWSNSTKSVDIVSDVPLDASVMKKMISFRDDSNAEVGSISARTTGIVLRSENGYIGVSCDSHFTPNANGGYDLGSNIFGTIIKWRTVYTTKISNGSDINVPNTAGTMSVQVSSLPTAASTNVGEIYQYIGATDSTYTHGYIYECKAQGTEYTGDVAIAASGGDLMVECDGDDFINFLMTEGSVADPTIVISGGMVYTAGTTTWTLTAYDNNNNTVCTISATQSDYESAGFTFYGTPADGNTCSFVSTITSTPTYAWVQTDVQSAGATYTAGTGIDITSGVISVGNTVLMNTSYNAGGNINLTIAGYTQNVGGLNIGYGSSITGTNGFTVGNASSASGYACAVGNDTKATGWNSFAFGFAEATADHSLALGNAKTTGIGAIQISGASNSGSFYINSDANTFKVANANGNFEIMSADGTVPTARLTKVNTTATLAVADWSSNTQTVTVSGVKADSVVFVSPAPASASDYASAGILCTTQAANSLTFTCTTTPSNTITVNVVCM